MATSANSKATDQSQFSLKHRLIGAAILISFGVLVLPWLLGSYSTEQSIVETKSQKNVKPSSIATLANKAASKTVDKGNGNPSTPKPSDIDDKKDVKVFVSRVQPLENSAKKSQQKKSTASASTEAVKPKKESKKETSKPKTQNAKTAKKDTKKKPVKETKKKTNTKKVTAKKAPVKASSPTANNKTIDRGYIVSVGVFGDTKNVEKMLSDLKSKSFNPSVRKEEFNSKNVSRIYMGPFKTRAEAGKVKLRLSEKGVPKTLIKVFP